MATTTNYSWTTPDDTDLVKDGASAIRSLGSAIDSTVFTNAGNAVQKSTIDAKGDLLVGTADNTISRLAVGTNNYVLTADSAEASGIKWAAVGGGGKVLQVVQATYSTEATSTSTTWADTGLSASITPSATNSKILVLVNQHTWIQRSSSFSGGGLRLLRGSTDIYGDNAASTPGTFWTQSGSGTAANMGGWTNLTYLDSPSTTSSTTYKTQFAAHELANSGQMKTSYGSTDSSITLLEIGA